MRVLEQIAQSPFPLIPFSQNPNFNSTSIVKGGSFFGRGFYKWLVECHGFFHNIVLIVSSLCFVLYLSFQAKKSFSKLSNGRSHIMTAYYGCLWLVSLLNLAWCCLQVCGFQSKLLNSVILLQVLFFLNVLLAVNEAIFLLLREIGMMLLFRILNDLCFCNLIR